MFELVTKLLFIYLKDRKMCKPNYIKLRKCIDLLKENTFKIRHPLVKLWESQHTSNNIHISFASENLT